MSIEHPEIKPTIDPNKDMPQWPTSREQTVTPDLKNQDDLVEKFDGIVDSISTADTDTAQEVYEEDLLQTPENPPTPVNPTEKRKWISKKNIKIGIAAAALGSIAPFGISAALSGGGDNTPEQQPGVNGPEKTGDIGGVSLSKDQLESYTSGNPEERNEVLDEVLLPATEKALNDPSKLSILSTDPVVLDKLKGLTEDAHNRAGASEEGEVYITVAPTELDDTNDEAFNNEPSVLNEGEDVILPVKIDSVVNGEVKVRYTLEGITVTLNGDHLAFTSNQ